MAILDQYGNPLERSVLSEPQTSKLANLRREFAAHPSRGLTPATLASILEGAETGNLQAQAELFADMEEKDGHILAEMGKRKRALLTIPWTICPPANASAAEKKLAEEVKEWIDARADLDDLIFDLMDAAGHAYSCVEIEWERIEKEWHPKKFLHRLPTWFQLDRETHSELRLRDPSGAGAPLQPFGWIVHYHKAKSGHIARAGLHRALAWPYIYKNYAVRDLAEFLEIYGLPVRLGKYPAGSGAAEKATLLRAVVEIGHNAAGIIPDGMALELMEAAQGTEAPFVAQMDWCERTESKIIVGQVLSAEAKATGLGSGVADLQSEVRADLKLSDARQLAGTLSRELIYPWLALNKGFDDPRRAPYFEFDTQEPEDLALYAESLPKLVDMGMRITTAYAHERLKIPVAKDGEDVLRAAAPKPAAVPNVVPFAPKKAALRSTLPGASAAEDQDEITDAAAELSAEWEKLIGPRVDELTAMLAETHDLATFGERLAALLKADPPPALVESLTRAGFIAALMGQTSQRGDLAQFGEHMVAAAKLHAGATADALVALAEHTPPAPVINVTVPERNVNITVQPARQDVAGMQGLIHSIGLHAKQVIDGLSTHFTRHDIQLTLQHGSTEKTVILPDGRKMTMTEKDK